MALVAIVTGGPRGIGATIARALEARGCRVGAVYHGNTTAARAFSAETGLPIFKWDVADFDACAAGVQEVERELGHVDNLVNNAGGTRDTTLHHMTPQQWSDAITTDLRSVFNMCRNVIEGVRQRGRQHFVHQWTKGTIRPDQLCRGQSWHDRFHQGTGPRSCRPRASP